jgi:hypothetical protein
MTAGLKTGMGLLAVGGMEACWLMTGLRLIGPMTGPGALPLIELLAGLPLAFWLRRLSAALPRAVRIGLGPAAGLIWVMWSAMQGMAAGPETAPPDRVAALFSALLRWTNGPNPVQLSMAGGAVAWGCGIRLAAARIDFDRLLTEFQFGLVLLVILFFSAGQLNLGLPEAGLTAVVFFGFFTAGAAAVRGSLEGGWMRGDSRGRWLGVAAIYAALVLGLGLILAAAATPGLLRRALDLLIQLWDLLAELVAGLLALLARLLPQPDIAAHPTGGGRAGPTPEGPNIPDLLQITESVRRVAGMLVGAFWVVLLAVSLWRIAAQIAGWLRQQVAAADGTEVRRLDGAFGEDLLRLARWLWGRLRGWGAAIGLWMRRPGRPGAATTEAAAVRRLYRRLLIWSAARGCRRRPHQTPGEFLEDLCRWRPQARHAFRCISEHYVAVFYGDIRPEPQAVRDISSAWRQVQRARKNGRSKR